MRPHPTSQVNRERQSERAARSTVRFLAVFLLATGVARCAAPQQDWTNRARIAAYELGSDNAEAIAHSAQANQVFGIEVDNDITGRYESYLDPTQKLKDIRAVAEAAHRAGNKAFVYIAGLECITANADKSAHSMAKDHPDWIQRKFSGEPAIFGAGVAFWIQKGDEDVWISPYAMEWRKTYMERVRQIAATGIDGIYVDIPYWMTVYDGWENTWTSFDDYTVKAFRDMTGLDARHDIKLGDFSDVNFRKWIDFRIATLTDFVREIGETARSVNPKIKTIPEIFPGIEEEAVRTGADVYQMYDVVDAIAHEYEFGGGDHMASSRTQLDWFLYQVGMLTFRAFAQGKATWILNYSWDGDKGVGPREPMKNLAMSHIIAGANFWDAPGHVMAGSNDMATRKEIFRWIAKNEKILYSPRLPIQPVGVYFSPATRNFSTAQFLSSYQGVLLLLMQNHREFQILTPRTLASFRGKVLVLPDVSILGKAERAQIGSYVSGGGRLVVTGTDETQLASSSNIVRFRDCPGKAHLAALEKDFAEGSKDAPKEFLTALDTLADLSIEAPPLVASNVALVNGQPHMFFANFSGLVPHKVAIPTPTTNVVIRIAIPQNAELYVLPFLGEVQKIGGKRKGNQIEFVIPRVERGAIAWIEKGP
jgi:hypothetical protein